MNRNSRRMALGGMMAALAAAVMLLGGVIPAATFCCPAIAALALIPLIFDCGDAWAWTAWGAVALLSLMLCPDKEAALLFVFLGWYPIVKWRLERIPRSAVRLAAKLILWNLALGLMYALIFFVLRLDAITAEYREMGLIMGLIMLLLGNITLILYDFLLLRFSMIYLKRFRRR